MPKTFEEVRRLLGFHRPAARVRSAEGARYRPDDEWTDDKQAEVDTAVDRVRADLLAGKHQPADDDSDTAATRSARRC